MRWQAWHARPVVGTPLATSVAEADMAFRLALAEATADLEALGLSSWRPDATAGLGRRGGVASQALPPTLGSRSLRLLDRAEKVLAILAVAEEDPGGAVTGWEAGRRSASLAGLSRATRARGRRRRQPAGLTRRTSAPRPAPAGRAAGQTRRQRTAGRAGSSVVTSSDLWDAGTAERYDEGAAAMSAPEVLGPTVDALVRLADGGPALELAVGTGRVAVPLLARGVPVTGVELSPAMVEVLRRKVDEDALPVVVGDMATTRVPGTFSLVYLVWNTVGNLRTQDEQVACFANAAAHLRPGGRFVVEVGVPALRRLPPGQTAVPFHVDDGYLGVDTYDVVTQQATSHHWTREPDGTLRRAEHRFRYVWPSELDLMARLAGLVPEHRWAGWDGSPFTADSESHVSVWRRP